MADLDFGAPSFSLGLDLDFDSNPVITSPTKDPLTKSPRQSSINSIHPIIENDEDFHFQTEEAPDPGPPSVLKRLRRGSSSSSSVTHSPAVSRIELLRPSIADEDIEEFSSQEDPQRDEYPPMQNHSACSSSKFSLHNQRVLTTRSSKLKTPKSTLSSCASTFTSLEESSNKGTLPKLTISPLRKIQLLDSDSDDPPSAEDEAKNCKKAVTRTEDRPGSHSHVVLPNQQKQVKTSSNTCHIESLWRDFKPEKNKKLATPAFDEFYKEYFESMEDKNVHQRKKGDMVDNSRSPCPNYFMDENDGCLQENSIDGGGKKHCANQGNHLPPAYHYFYHKDPRIQKLIRDRLHNFFPIGAMNQRGSQHSEAPVIDYMSQFGHKDPSTEVHTTRKRGHQASSTTAKRSRKNANVKEVSQASEGWFNSRTSTIPRDAAKIPRDAAKRRVHADGHSAGHWYTGQDGRKVYVNKNGQELTGQAAYRHYRKESGAGFRKSRKKTASKKSRK